MKPGVIVLGCVIARIVFLGADTSAGTKASSAESLEADPKVRIGHVREIKLQRSFAVSAQEAAQISNHIANLTKIDKPDFGLSATMDGMAFAAIPGTGKATGGFLLARHGLETSDDVRQLVALGPRALPFLLDALGDSRPTKLVLRQEGMFGGMFLATEMGINPTNSIEQKAFSTLPAARLGHLHDLPSPTEYMIKVGDVCFSIVGQIVGRRYQAVRYQPTAIVLINSPVESPPLARAVRDVWSSTNAAQHLLNSLLLDYATEGLLKDPSPHSWAIGNELQTAAALRLLYYFPGETAEMIAGRLARLDVRKTDNVTGLSARQATNGVRAEDFIKAVARSTAPAVHRELLDIFKRTDDPELLMAALPGVRAEEDALVLKRLREMIAQLPAEEGGPYGKGYELLVALGDRFGEAARLTFESYLKNAGLQRWRSMAMTLRQTRPEWAPDLLRPALSDKREFGWTYAVVPGKNEPRRPIRVCDEAAETISLSRTNLQFKMAGERGDLDRQIATMLQQLRTR